MRWQMAMRVAILPCFLLGYLFLIVGFVNTIVSIKDGTGGDFVLVLGRPLQVQMTVGALALLASVLLLLALRRWVLALLVLIPASLSVNYALALGLPRPLFPALALLIPVALVAAAVGTFSRPGALRTPGEDDPAD